MTQQSKAPQDAADGLYIAAQIAATVLTYLVAAAAAKFHNVADTMAFYGVYHREPWNQFIHFFGVPTLIWTLFIFLAYLPLPILGQFEIQIPLTPRHPITWSIVWMVGYIIFYIKIDPFGGSLYAPVLYGMYALAVRLAMRDQEAARKKSDDAPRWYGTGKLLRNAMALHIFSWYLQIHPGHKIIEGAQPALMQSLGGALTSAPLFAFYEGLWFLGINRDVQNETLRLVAQYTKELCAAGATMRACATA
jgi:uncharacterized membrane protein YGL010W